MDVNEVLILTNHWVSLANFGLALFNAVLLVVGWEIRLPQYRLMLFLSVIGCFWAAGHSLGMTELGRIK